MAPILCPVERRCLRFSAAENRLAALRETARWARLRGMGLLSSLFAKKEPPVHVNDANFAEEVLKSDLPVVLDVWSPSCAPCQKLEEVMFALRKRYDGRVKVCELSSANAQKTAAKLRISATPTVLYFQGGREKDRVMGFRSSLYHQEAIEELFGIAPKA